MLEAINLSKKYGQTEAVHKAGFFIKEGEAVGLIGRNGAGKSTVMRMLTGYLAPTEGSVRVFGTNMAEAPHAARRHIGYMPEVPPLYPDLTVREHLLYVASLRGFSGTRARGEAERVSEALCISDMGRRPIKNLSKGLRQRVGFAAALVGSPKFMILDEPTAGLDPGQTVEFRRIVASLSGSVSFLVSSHILSEIASICSRILILHGGRIVANGSPEGIAREHCGPASVEVEILGPAALAREVLEDRVGKRAIVSEERTSQNTTRFEIALDGERPDDPGLRCAVFAAVAEKRELLSIVTLRSREHKLEDIFMDLTEHRDER
ncbi:MAG: ABC transporter ATP-binding protein [Synergistaceae bacterium]|jgi:ABC-2 type transport system ATP-binding protein|nr:ABC transporter ATP-binding protein [Synergistaceae bacterium]